MSTEPTTVAPEADLDDDIIEAVVFLRLRRLGPGADHIEQADREFALARLARAGVPVPVYPRNPAVYHVIADETWMIEPDSVDVRTDAEQVEAARWAVTPQ
jgi:hypothetical protein